MVIIAVQPVRPVAVIFIVQPFLDLNPSGPQTADDVADMFDRTPNATPFTSGKAPVQRNLLKAQGIPLRGQPNAAIRIG
jgi:hypothetical protein